MLPGSQLIGFESINLHQMRVKEWFDCVINEKLLQIAIALWKPRKKINIQEDLLSEHFKSVGITFEHIVDLLEQI